MRRKRVEINWEAEIRSAKRANTTAFIVTLVLTCALAFSWIVSGFSCRFSPKRWAEYPQKRTRIVSDLLRRHDPIGMTPSEVTSLLGDGQSQTQNDGTLILRYPLGVDPIFVPNGNAVLEIRFHNGLARSCRIIKT